MGLLMWGVRPCADHVRPYLFGYALRNRPHQAAQEHDAAWHSRGGVWSVVLAGYNPVGCGPDTGRGRCRSLQSISLRGRQLSPPTSSEGQPVANRRIEVHGKRNSKTCSAPSVLGRARHLPLGRAGWPVCRSEHQHTVTAGNFGTLAIDWRTGLNGQSGQTQTLRRTYTDGTATRYAKPVIGGPSRHMPGIHRIGHGLPSDSKRRRP